MRARHVPVLREQIHQQILAPLRVPAPAVQVGLDDGQRQVAGARAARPGQEPGRVVVALPVDVGLRQPRLEARTGGHQRDRVLVHPRRARGILEPLVRAPELVQHLGQQPLRAHRARLLQHRRQRLDDALVLVPALEHLGQHVGSPQSVRLQLDQAAGGRLGRVEVGEGKLHLGQHVEAGRVARAHLEDAAEHVAGAHGLVALQQRRGQAAPDPGAARVQGHRAPVGLGGVAPAAGLLVQLAQTRQHPVRGPGAAHRLLQRAKRFVVTARLLVRLGQQDARQRVGELILGQVLEQRDRLVRRGRPQIEARQRQLDLQIRHHRAARLLQMHDDLIHVLARAFARGRRRGIGQPQHAVRRAVVGLAGQRLLGDVHGVLGAAGPAYSAASSASGSPAAGSSRAASRNARTAPSVSSSPSRCRPIMKRAYASARAGESDSAGACAAAGPAAIVTSTGNATARETTRAA